MSRMILITAIAVQKAFVWIVVCGISRLNCASVGEYEKMRPNTAAMQYPKRTNPTTRRSNRSRLSGAKILPQNNKIDAFEKVRLVL